MQLQIESFSTEHFPTAIVPASQYSSLQWLSQIPSRHAGKFSGITHKLSQCITTGLPSTSLTFPNDALIKKKKNVLDRIYNHVSVYY